VNENGPTPLAVLNAHAAINSVTPLPICTLVQAITMSIVPG
jgi:hypothetical protein